ncbi:MAG: alpha-ketoglutarate-dependent dioxygenase AlkB family protein [Lysobacter sp.]
MSVSVRQPSLFDVGPRVLIDDDQGGVTYRPDVVDLAAAARWFDALRDSVAWQAMRRPMYDRVVDVPRLVSAYRLESDSLPGPLADVAALMRAELGEPFNTVGLNYYRDGNDSVAPHNDKLQTLVPGHPIALLSLGATRRMTIRAKHLPGVPALKALTIDLEPGSVLAMSYESQLHYDHGIPKTRDGVGPRISLAFRVRPADHRSRLTDRSLQPARPGS